MTDTQYSILSGEAFKYAFSIVKNEADAQDIVQNAMLKMLMREETLESPKYYLLKCVKNGAVDMFRRQKKEVKLGYYALSAPGLVEEDESIDEITESKAKELLTVTDFRTYKMYIKYKQIKKIAKVRKIPYGTALTQVNRMRTNLKSAILKDSGALSSIALLSFQQADNVRKLIKQIVKNGSNTSKMFKYFENCKDIPEITISRFLDWNYTRKNNADRICLIYLQPDEQINAMFFYFNITSRNGIKIHKVLTTPKIVPLKNIKMSDLKKDPVTKIIPVTAKELLKKDRQMS